MALTCFYLSMACGETLCASQQLNTNCIRPAGSPKRHMRRQASTLFTTAGSPVHNAGSPESDNGRVGSEAAQPGASRPQAQGSRQANSPVLIALPGQRAAACGGPSGGLQAGDMAGLLGGSALARHHAQQQQAQQQLLPSQRLGALLG